MSILVGSSYYEGGKGGVEFRRMIAHKWYFNVMKMRPEKVVIICQAGSRPPAYAGVEYVHHVGDLGHCHDLIEGRKPHEFSSWSASMLACALLAYDAELDYCYVEGDCFPFGDVKKQMYADMGDGQMVFGAKHKTAPFMPCSQSLFLVRHAFIPTFVASYLALGGERDRHNLGEHKFCRMADKFGHVRCRRLTFGVDRERPIPWTAPAFYFQQPTAEEISEATKRGLL